MSPHAHGPAEGPPPIDRLNRYVLVVTPRQPWVDWAASLGLEGEGEDGRPISLEEAELEYQATFLVPFAWETELVVDWIRDNVDLLFEQMLHALEPDPTRWPPERGADAFEEWFALDLLDAPIDLVDAPLYADEADEEE